MTVSLKLHNYLSKLVSLNSATVNLHQTMQFAKEELNYNVYKFNALNMQNSGFKDACLQDACRKSSNKNSIWIQRFSIRYLVKSGLF